MKSHLRMLGNKVGVHTSAAAIDNEVDKDTLFVNKPQTSHLFGEVKYIGEGLEEPGFKVGDFVYYGPHLEDLVMEGERTLVMEVSNVVAVKEFSQVEESISTTKSSEV